MKNYRALCLAVCAVTAACGSDGEKQPFDTSSFADAVEMAPGNSSGHYRDDLTTHRGCTPRASYAGQTEPLVVAANNTATRPASQPANIPGYPCAAVEWVQPNEDTSKPIVILVHGNSSGVGSWEEWFSTSVAGTTLTTSSLFSFTADGAAREMLASKLIAARYRVYGFDARTDLTFDANDPENSNNVNRNMDHGWGTPMLQAMIKAVIAANPGRKISLIGHSLGVSLIRDALRRLFVAYGAAPESAPNPFASVKDLIFLSGANHGVVGGAAGCVENSASTSKMTIAVNCELGDRDAFQPTYFWAPINGANDAFATPCADGNTAFGRSGECDGNTVQYTTVVMQDKPNGTFQDEFVTEASAALNSGQPIDNHLISLDDYDSSGYFFDGLNGIFANHFGSARSNTGMAYVLQKLAD